MQEKCKDYRCKTDQNKNVSFMLSSKCAVCGSKKSEEAEGL